MRTVHRAVMQIAGVRFTILCEEASILDEPDPAYGPFSGNAVHGPGSADIEVRLELGNMPDTEGMARVFDTAESWSMLSDGTYSYIALTTPLLGRKPIWLARVLRDFTQVHIYCGDRLVKEEGGRTCVANPVRYPLDQILLMYFLAWREGALLHAAGIGIGGKGFIFPGRSGAGKSTLMRHILQEGRIDPLSDDRVIVRRINDTYRAYGTPWPGEAGIATNSGMPLSGILFIHHGTENRIDRIEPREAMEKLLPLASIPWYDRKAMPQVLDICETLIARIPAYEFHFRPEAEAAHVLETFALG